MNEDGVAGLTMTGLARAMRIQPPSLYKYFPSVTAVHDALYRRGQEDNLAALRAGMAAAEPGWAALRSGLEALGRWAVTNPVLAQLLFWRPMPGFGPARMPSPRARDRRAAARRAVRRGRSGPARAGRCV